MNQLLCCGNICRSSGYDYFPGNALWEILVDLYVAVAGLL
eukprot:CAMPEP_0117881146 /NCGR_PEP_ID=MMETSP0950-20121206/16631_1 /TAXON_ID=44440 /ORGANISM="Chattonella subsalsa, Strain CCMP2191" /LENGTH=39 /DNA_ID= /DNA_START= /DNA_END= /DNA_ORIENTATION=